MRSSRVNPSRRDALTLLGVSVAAACSRSVERATREYPELETPRTRVETSDVVLGAFASLSGPERAYGEALRRGFDVARAEIAARGGVKGRPLQVLLRDDEGRADGAALAARLATVDERLVGLVGGSSRALAVAAARAVKDATFVAACASRDDGMLLGPRGIGLAPSAAEQARVLAEHLFGSITDRTTAILACGANDARTTATGGAQVETFEDEFASAAPAHAATVVAREHVAGAEHVADVLARTRAEVMLVGGRGSPLASVAARVRALQPSVQVVCGLDFDARGLWSRDLDGVQFATALAPDAPAEFTRVHRELFASDPDGLAALGRDALMLLVTALETSETTEYDAIAASAREARFARASSETPSIAEIVDGNARFVAAKRGA